jgi:adenylate kinase family enzyme
MNRIAIVGCSGGGKSTLARTVGAALGLPVVHLDALFWKPGWVESDPEPFRAAVTSVADLSLGRADTIVWIDQPMPLCLSRAIWRGLTGLGRTRADLAPGCPEKIDFAFYRYIVTWSGAPRTRLQGALDRFAPHAPLVRLRSDRAIAAWVGQVGATAA